MENRTGLRLVHRPTRSHRLPEAAARPQRLADRRRVPRRRLDDRQRAGDDASARKAGLRLWYGDYGVRKAPPAKRRSIASRQGFREDLSLPEFTRVPPRSAGARRGWRRRWPWRSRSARRSTISRKPDCAQESIVTDARAIREWIERVSLFLSGMHSYVGFPDGETQDRAVAVGRGHRPGDGQEPRSSPVRSDPSSRR